MDITEKIHLKGILQTLKLQEKRSQKMKKNINTTKKRIKKFDINKLSKEIIFKNLQVLNGKSI